LFFDSCPVHEDQDNRGRKAISYDRAKLVLEEELSLVGLGGPGRLLAAFHIKLPAIANIAIPTKMPISRKAPWSNLSR
jgi:hypothetical protein